MSEELIYSKYKESYRKLNKLDISKKRRKKISSILYHAYELNEPVPDVGLFQNMPLPRLEQMLTKYNKRLQEKLHPPYAEPRFGVHTVRGISWMKMMSELEEEETS